jgi:hypothetical protein
MSRSRGARLAGYVWAVHARTQLGREAQVRLCRRGGAQALGCGARRRLARRTRARHAEQLGEGEVGARVAPSSNRLVCPVAASAPPRSTKRRIDATCASFSAPRLGRIRTASDAAASPI